MPSAPDAVDQTKALFRTQTVFEINYQGWPDVAHDLHELMEDIDNTALDVASDGTSGVIINFQFETFTLAGDHKSHPIMWPKDPHVLITDVGTAAQDFTGTSGGFPVTTLGPALADQHIRIYRYIYKMDIFPGVTAVGEIDFGTPPANVP